MRTDHAMRQAPASSRRRAAVARGGPASAGSLARFSADHPPTRIHIAGGSGTGKSTLAKRLGALLDLPVHELDYVARDFDAQRVRSLEEREALVAEIVASGAWVTDGIHVGWTDVLCREADLIIWLDQVSWPIALARVLRRFVRGGIAEARRQRGLRRFFRPRDYARHALELYRVSREIRTFATTDAPAQTGDGGSRAAIAAQLKPFTAKVGHFRSPTEVDAFVAQLEAQLREPVVAGG